jgi:hypothetical protein
MKLLVRACHLSGSLASRAYASATLWAASPTARMLMAGISPT